MGFCRGRGVFGVATFGVLADAMPVLACPHCGSGVELDESTVLCERGHAFDVARQGYVSLLPGSAGKIVGDSAPMVAARDAFFATGHYDRLMDAVADAVGPARVVLDVGCGTGAYLARVLDGSPDAVGVGVDVSKFAARRAARSHPRCAAVVADVWQHLPIRDESVDTVMSVFSPRNTAELRRVIAPGGSLVVLTPTEHHLEELVRALTLIRVDENKSRRLGESMAGQFERVRRTAVTYTSSMSHSDIEAVVAMGPSARHGESSDRADIIAALPDPYPVTVSVIVAVYEPI